MRPRRPVGLVYLGLGGISAAALLAVVMTLSVFFRREHGADSGKRRPMVDRASLR